MVPRRREWSKFGELRMWNLTLKKPENCTKSRFLEQDSAFLFSRVSHTTAATIAHNLSEYAAHQDEVSG